MVVTLFIGCLGGYLFLRWKVPAGGIVGSMLFVAVYNVWFQTAYAPWYYKLFAQSITGAFIAMPLTIEKIKSMKTVLRPALIVMIGMLATSVAMGFLCVFVSGRNMDLLTAFFFSAPGGMSDIVLTSTEVGGDTLMISAGHALRSLFVLGVLPLFSKRFSQYLIRKNPEKYDTPADEDQGAYQKNARPFSWRRLLLTLALALTGGCLGRFSGFPAGTLLFSLIAVSSVHIPTQIGCMPLPLRRFAQMCAGTLIGCNITRESLINIRYILLPLIILLLGNLLMNIFLGLFLYFKSDLDLSSSLFATIPAGVADMALLADELNGDGAKVALVQTIRLVSVIVLFPQVYLFLAEMFQ